MTTVLRIVPPMLRDVRRPQRMVERNVVAYRRQWIILLSGFFEPLFYLLSMRVGLRDLIGAVKVGGEHHCRMSIAHRGAICCSVRRRWRRLRC